MNSDRYMKVVLTIIAINLTVISVRSMTEPSAALAQSAPVPVRIVSVDSLAFSLATVPVKVR